MADTDGIVKLTVILASGSDPRFIQHNLNLSFDQIALPEIPSRYPRQESARVLENDVPYTHVSR